MPAIALDAGDAVELAELLQFLGGWLESDRDLEQEWSQETAQRVTTENTTLKQRVRQLIQDSRTLEERLQAARSNARFADRRIAQLEADLADSPGR